MSHVLPSDCANIILSYLSLQTFARYDPKPWIWRQRFLFRYGQVLDHDIKRQYLVRAATEYHEVSTYSLQYCAPAIVCYHASIGGNWELLNDLVDKKFTGIKLSTGVLDILGDLFYDIFTNACRQN